MNVWIFSSNTLENIRVAKERLLWGFWNREIGEKQRKNWRNFIRLYNRIKPFDTVVFQISRTEEIHAIGVVKEKFYEIRLLHGLMKEIKFFSHRRFPSPI